MSEWPKIYLFISYLCKFGPALTRSPIPIQFQLDAFLFLSSSFL